MSRKIWKVLSCSEGYRGSEQMKKESEVRQVLISKMATKMLCVFCIF